MKRIFKYISLLLILLGLGACAGDSAYQEKAADPEIFHRASEKLTSVIVHDIFSPPVASRIYSYAYIAAYEGFRNGYPEYQSVGGQLNGLSAFPEPEAGQEYCFPVAGLQAFLVTGKALIFSEEEIEAQQEEVAQGFRKMGIPRDVYDRSIAYGEAVAKHVLAWAAKDNYKESRTFSKYTVIHDDPARWQPTPPDYMDALEPHWGEIRPFTLDSASQFAPPRPTPFDTNKNSQFIKEATEVYHAFDTDKEHREAIAKFWDDSPYVSHHAGHVMFATKKITPGGHWISIARIAARKAKADIMRAAEAYMLTSICLADGFISCWEEKFRSNYIRPETAINKYIDEDWRPLLQTPPFPEYTSGHSVISSAATVAMESVYGKSFEFTDNTEEPFGMPARTFKSFKEASLEAAISRMYGGIHFRPAVDNGVAQGERVGQHVVSKIITHAQTGSR